MSVQLSPEQAQQLQNASPEQRQQMMQAMRGRPMPAGAQPAPGGKPEEKKPEDAKKDDKGEKKDEGGKTIKREDDKSKADPEELKVKPDKNGKVQFNFRGQPWNDVLEWFAAIGNYSLDWQELPGDKLNLSTQRPYTVAETRSLLNRHLLARGFTMLLQGEGLSVVKTDKIDPSLVPRVEADNLDDQAPFDFVRTRFAIPETMDPAKAVEDVKVVLSPAAKVTPLLASKQLQVMDAVTNLRDVRDLMYSEQLAASKDVRPRQFGPFRHRRADYIADQVMIVLGMDPQQRKNPMEMQMEQQRMQMLMQLQQKGTDITKMIKGGAPEVFIAVDKRRNSLLVNAPPKEMEIVERTIKQFDVPENGAAAEQEAEDPLDDRSLSFRRHSTVSVSPEAIVTALKDMGALDPLTQLQSDARSKTIFAFATEKDHKAIEALIDKLDGSGRSLKVVWLNRRTSADQVAGTIKALMVGEKKKEENRRPYWYYDFYDRGNNEEEPDTGFRIQADIDNNRLLLWANDDEFAEVNKLLEQLGAVASNNRNNPNKYRVLEARTPEETAEMLERLKQSWSGQNQLNIVAPPVEEPKEKEEPAAAAPAGKPPTKDRVTSNRVEAGARFSFAMAKQAPREPRFLLVAEAQEAAAPASEQPAAEQPSSEQAPATNEAPAAEHPAAAAPSAEQSAAETPNAEAPSARNTPGKAPPVNVTVTPDGRIVLSSDDPGALDQVEDLLKELEPPRRDFHVFKLKNSRASLVVLNLEEYFEDELGEDKDTFGWWWDDEQNKDEPATLGKARKLRFIYDIDTNTIVAQNASPAQLETIAKLIQIYDQEISEDSVGKRYTDVVQIKYSQAQDIATAIKEVYRDLLSSKDKEFQGGREGNDRDRGSRESRYSFWPGGSSSQKSAPMKMSFEGALSIGVDEVSNTLIISAEEAIWQNVRDLAMQLDEKAKPTTVVQVHQLRGGISASELQDSLRDALSQPWPGGKPLQANQNRGGDQNRGRDRNNGDRGRGDRGRDGDRGRGDRGNRD